MQPLAPGERRAAAALLARAFRDNPLNRAVLAGRGPRARLRANRAGLAATLAAALGAGPERARVLAGRAHPGGPLAAALVGLPAGAWPLPPPSLARRLAVLALQGPGVAGRWAQVFDALAGHHPTAPHAYLATLGVDPPHQGRGLGRALLAHWLAEVDAAGATAWLETDREANLGFYAPAGFRVRGEARVLGVRVWLLRRPLKGGAREDDPPGQHG